MKRGFGNASTPSASPAKPRSKPLKRPSQARAIFTVEAIYEAFVRIWLRQGWSAVTTRAVALEAGVAIGTLYDYFPSKEALLSGYVRYGIECLLARLDSDVVQPTELPWQERIERLLDVCCNPPEPDRSMFGYELIELEHKIAERKHQHRAYEELASKWREVFAACHDLPRQPDGATVDAWLTSVWGGRRYCLTAQLSAEQKQLWLAEMKAMVVMRVAAYG
ncbi:MAG: TetR/AcrR family transcriptional regulator [Pseudomonas sp.]